MKQTLSFIAVLAFAAATLFSCKKSDDNNGNPGTSASIIGSWTPTAINSDKPYEWEPGVVGTDGYTYHAACASQSYITFTQGATTTTGTGLTYDDCNKANGSFTWILQSTILTTSGGSDKTIEQLDGSTMIYSYTVIVNGQPIRITDKFKRK